MKISTAEWIGVACLLAGSMLCYDVLVLAGSSTDASAGTSRGILTFLESLASVAEPSQTLRSMQLYAGVGTLGAGGYLLWSMRRKPALRTVVIHRSDSSPASEGSQASATQPLFEDPSITFKVVEMVKDPLTDAEAEADAGRLPEAFARYRRSRRMLLVMAATPEELVVGMGGGWVYEHATKAPLLWIKTAQVDPPFDRTTLARSLISALLLTAEKQGFAGAYVEASVHQHAG